MDEQMKLLEKEIVFPLPLASSVAHRSWVVQVRLLVQSSVQW